MQNPAMRGGLCGFSAPDEDVFAMLRSLDGSCALVLVNRSEQAKQVSVRASDFAAGPDAGRLTIAERLRDALTDAVVETRDGAVNIVLPPLSGALLVNG
jgi:hypothetical protein